MARLALLGIGLLLVVTWSVVSALTACLNESPRFAQVAQSAQPDLTAAAAAILRPFGLSPASCEPSLLARVLALAGLAYLAGLLLLDRVPRRSGLSSVVVVTLVCQVVLFATPGLLSTDILDYASYGRVAAVHGLNPYVVTPDDTFTSDPFLGYGAWQGVVTVYGPLWTSIDAWIARMLPVGDPVQLVLAYKSLAFVLQLANLGLLWRLLRRWLPGPAQVTALAVYAWNPLVLLELVGNGHNETLMVLFVLLGLASLSVAAGSLSGGRTFLGGWPWLLALVFFELGALVKFVPAAIGAATVLVWLRRLPDGRTRLAHGALAGAVLLLVALVVSWPWLTSADLLLPLQGILSGGQRFKDGWQDAVAAWVAVRILPPLGVPPDPATLRESVSRSIAWGLTRVVFVVYLGWEIRYLWRQSRTDQAIKAIVESSARCLLFAVLLFVTQVYPWYFLWPLPLVALLGWGHPLTRAVVAFSITFLPAYYLREFQSYGIFYLPLYLLAALLVLAGTQLRAARLATSA